jgi:serine protease Do
MWSFVCSLALLASPAVSPAAPKIWTDADAKGRALGATPSVAPLVERVEPAVLVVFVEGQEETQAPLPPGHPPLPPGPSGPQREDGDDEGRGQGAGFLISKEGYALTSHHVVEGATRITVLVGDDRTEVEAELLGSDARADVALLRLRSARTDWPVVPLGDSDAVKVGDYVVAIGSPFGLEQSVSLGIISARSRRDIAPSGRPGLYDFLQTDASINPGNSGGPLLDLSGAVVGINAAINAAATGIGFAVPINMVKRMLPSLLAKGRYERSWIGVSILDVTTDLAPGLGLVSPRGALVREVVSGGPADVAGIVPGDVIVGFDSRPLRVASDLPLRAGDAGVGATVILDVVRNKAPVRHTVTLGSHPDNERSAARPGPSEQRPPSPQGRSIGMSIVGLDERDAERLGLPAPPRGARITRIRPASPAMAAGLEVDDVIVDVNGVSVPDASGAAGLVEKTPSGELLKIIVMRKGSRVFCVIKKP